GSTTRRGPLVEEGVDIGPESLSVDGRCAVEDGEGGVRSDKLTLPKRDQLSHRHAVAGDDERLATVECSHDFSAFVAQFSLSDLTAHRRTVARVLRQGRARLGDSLGDEAAVTGSS